MHISNSKYHGILLFLEILISDVFIVMIRQHYDTNWVREYNRSQSMNKWRYGFLGIVDGKKVHVFSSGWNVVTEAVCGPGLPCMSTSLRGPSSQNTNWTSKLSNYVPRTPGDGPGCQHRYSEHKEKPSQMWNNIFWCQFSFNPQRLLSNQYDLLKILMNAECRWLIEIYKRQKLPSKILGWQGLGRERMETFLFN